MTAEIFVDPERLQYARILREQGFGWHSIVAKTGISLYLLRCHLIPGYREHKRELTRKAEERRKGTPRACRRYRARKKSPDAPAGISGRFERHITRLEVPQEVEADRDRRKALELARQDFTQAFCGDPLPGYSALEKRPSVENKIHGRAQAVAVTFVKTDFR